MRTLQCVAVAALALVAIGCSSNNKGKIEGTKWSSNSATIQGRSIPAGALTLEFKPDGSMVYNTPGGRFTGTYSLGMGDTVHWKFNRALAGIKDHAQKVTITGSTMKVADSDGTSISFSRVN